MMQALGVGGQSYSKFLASTVQVGAKTCPKSTRPLLQRSKTELPPPHNKNKVKTGLVRVSAGRHAAGDAALARAEAVRLERAPGLRPPVKTKGHFKELMAHIPYCEYARMW